MIKYLRESVKYILRSHIFVQKYVNEVEEMYGMSPKELRQRNEQRFLEIFRKAYTCSDYYRKLCNDNGVSSVDDIQCLEDIVKLPILTKDMLKAHGRELLTRKERGLIKNHTSGTTGTPLTVWQDWASVWREQAYFVCYRRRCGYNYGEPLVSLRGNLTRNKISLKVHVSNTLFLSSYNINDKTAETYHRLIEVHRPKAIEGYPSSLYSLALVLRDKGLECNIPVAFTSSETLFDYQRKLIEKVFNTQVYDHYGTTERTIRLEESFDHDVYFEDPGYGIEEYHDDYIISTSLINDVFPLIRYKTDDRVVLRGDIKKTPEGFVDYTGIDRIDGRSMTFIIGKDGTKYSDVALTFIFKDTKGVRYSQFIQKEIGKVDLNLVTDKTYTNEVEQKILQLIDKKVGLANMDVSIHIVTEKELKFTSRNKLILVVNELPAANSVVGGVISGIVGRTDDCLICKDGTHIVRLGFVVKDFDVIDKAQFVQTVKGKVELRVVSAETLSSDVLEHIRLNVEQRCGKGNMYVDVMQVSETELIQTASNKFKYIVSSLMLWGG